MDVSLSDDQRKRGGTAVVKSINPAKL